ncbi:AAA family ATPase [Litorivita pollutaquae]|uniref:AAA family ATPase n=1 Tax=Litorivita pollutaquae TaxID=2200892 RepID=UPI0013A60C2A|nr:AAA family ATPase [Litorivita pollutaquae]
MTGPAKIEVDFERGYDAFNDLLRIVQEGKTLPAPIKGAGPTLYRGKAKEPVRAFTFTAVGDLEYRPPAFLIGDLIETDTLGLVFGDPGCGKSFLAVALGLSVASGTPFFGRDVKQGSVFYIAGEGHNGLTRRFHAWGKHHGVDLSGVPLYKSERAAQFLDAASAKAVADAVDATAEQVGEPALIIVDTLARNFGAGDENSTMDMNNFVVAMDQLKARYPNSVLLIVHHSGHAVKDRARGAMALKGALDFEFRLEKSDATVTMTNTKMKDAEPPAPIHMVLQDVPLVDASSAVLVEGDAPAGGGKKLSPAKQLALDTYHMAAMKHGTLSDGAFTGLHVNDWREAFYQKHTGETTEAKRKAFDRARKFADLFDVNNDLYLLRGNGSATLLDALIEKDTRTDADET